MSIFNKYLAISDVRHQTKRKVPSTKSQEPNTLTPHADSVVKLYFHTLCDVKAKEGPSTKTQEPNKYERIPLLMLMPGF